jgi:hypothetical protein
MRITHFVRTATLITAHYKGDRTESVKRSAFEAWVADRQHNKEEGRLLSWSEYWSEPSTLADVQTYLDYTKRLKLVDHLIESLIS